MGSPHLRVRATPACLCSQQGQFPTTEGCEPLCDHITHRSPVPPPIFNKPAWDPKEEPSSSLDSASRCQDKKLSDLGSNGLHPSLTQIALCTYLPMKPHIHKGVYRL